VIDSGQGTWRVGRSRPPDMRVFIAYKRIGVDHKRHTVETLGVMVSILGHGTTYISEGDTIQIHMGMSMEGFRQLSI
jgi:hypothetical protein